MFQLRYPAGSVNPGSDPQGGADFYAVPPSLKSILPAARNVTLEYSVYFPEDFDWVKGGKLPGLYGGHESCSGGDDAESCFSTRMMWRPGGEGEIYLYAPRDKQASNVCATPPKTVCDSVYGMSLGRGSFAFALGGWTRITQTVVLNTPGSPDGSLDLDVNGQRVMSVQGVYYRNAPSASTPQNASCWIHSTFFGGHEQDYATPKDQFTYFGDFVMTVNS
ncbi:polysaccharide lyase family 14 protein [Exidia glandulosa HHB12029]|uniref:Polysaccharide lyase family 14 protein n=1 Tax=Exidia glandulosa HHB12029 TaxID=1314781 RepID=A0A165GJ93_EXIGL|nr:polysaccharide lyase family 14 protein [Exidia glandulosa HHB12029]